MTDVFTKRLLDALSPSPLIVVDLGARGGLDEDLLALAPAVVAVGFEPDAEEARRLAGTPIGPWKERRILPYAIGGATGSAKLHIPASPEGASLLPHNPAMLEAFGHAALHRTLREVEVDVRTLDDVADEAGIAAVDYLKIDIEGAELEVLKGGPQLAATAKVMKIECAFVEQRIGQPLAAEVIAYLASQGFDLIEIRAAHHWRRRPLPAHPYVVDAKVPYSRGRLAQADLFFVKRFDASALGRDVVAGMTILAALGHVDLAFTLLRAAPQAATWWNSRGIAIDDELSAVSRVLGRRELRKAIHAQIVGLVPLIRARLGRLPFRRPEMEY